MDTPVPFSAERHGKSFQALSSAGVLTSVSAQEGDFGELKTAESERPRHRACRLALVGEGFPGNF